MDRKTRLTKTFIGLMVLAAVTAAVCAGIGSHALHSYYALAVLALAAATSRMRVKLPGIEGNMSVNLPFLLMAVLSLSAVEAVLIASFSTVVQCWPQSSGKFRPDQMLFNVSMMVFATSMANLIWNAGWLAKASWASLPLVLAATTAAFFLGQTVPVAGIIKLTQGAGMRSVWISIAKLSFPYYVLSAGVTSMLNLASHRFGWQAALVVFPVMYGIHHSYRLYFGREGEVVRTSPLARAATAGA
ncbi:MAG: hypothetical protein WB762_33865 [Candidatus Sulfotelmatobacter sp.]